MAETCYPEIQNNEIVKQENILKLLKKLESCSTKEEIKTSINEILAEKEKEGLISIEEFKNRNLLISDSVALLAECSIKEMIPDFEGYEAQPSAIVNSILSFICNPPRLPTPKPFITLSKPFGDIFKGILNYLLEAVIQLISSLISDIMGIILDFCETGVDSFETFNKNLSNKLLNSLVSSTNNIFSTIQNIVNKFGFNLNGQLTQYELEEDVCTTPPNEIARPFNDLLNELPLILTPLEFCSLLEGSASKYTLNTVREVIKFEYPVLFIRLSNNDVIQELFKEIGNLLDPNICAGIRASEPNVSYDDYDDICNINQSRDNVRIALLQDRGHTPEQSLAILNKEKENISKKLSKISSSLLKLKRDPDKILEDIANTNIFCKDGNEGLVKLSDMPEVAKFYSNSIDACYNTIKSSFKQETDEIPSIFINGKVKRTKIEKLIDIQYTNANGRLQTLENVIDPKFLAQEQVNKIYYTLDSDYAAKDNNNDRITLDQINVIGGTDAEYLFDNKKLVINKSNNAEDVEDATNAIEGIVKESIEADSFEVPHIVYDLEENNTSINSTFNISLSILNEENNNAVKSIKDYSIINIPTVKVQTISEERLKNINIGLFNSFSKTKITDEQINQIVENSKEEIYGENSYSSGPFKAVSKEIAGYLRELYNVPDAYTTSLSPQEVAFRKFIQDKNIPYSSYLNILKNSIEEYSLSIEMEASSDLYQENFINKIQLLPINKLFGVVKEKEKVKQSYLNDPCALTENREDIPLFNKTIIYSCIDMIVRLHVLKNNLKMLYYLPFFELKELVKNDDSYIEFLLQTFKQDLTKLSGKRTTFYDNFIIYLDKYFDETESVGALTDPVTQEVLEDDDYSIDYKIRYFIKKQYMYLTKTMKVLNNVKVVNNLTLNNFSRIFSRIGEPETFQLKFYVNVDETLYDEQSNISITASQNSWKYGIGVFYNYYSDSYQSIQVAKYEKVGNFALNDDVFEFTNTIKQSLFEEFVKTQEYKILFDYCFSTSKIYSYTYINHIINNSINIPKSNSMFNSTNVALKDLFNSMLNEDIDPNCLTPDNLLNDIDIDFDLKKIIAKLTLETGIEIFKSLAERVDPNISIAKPISTVYNSTIGAVSGVTLPVLPFSLGLLPFGTIPLPIGVGPPLTPTYGYTYLALDTLLYALSISEKQQKYKFSKSSEFDDENLDNFEEEC
jgi:hypothetical protein